MEALVGIARRGVWDAGFCGGWVGGGRERADVAQVLSAIVSSFVSISWCGVGSQW